jgi:DNA-binding response OmpR family regulator
MEFHNTKILIIDDDQNLADMVALVFLSEGAKVFKAVNGKEGLKEFFTHRPDVVILDIVMPELNGWETCHQIRLMADTPIIMLTTMAEDQDIVKGLEYGADDFIAKPFSPEVLKARVAAVLRRVKTESAQLIKPHLFHDDYLTINLNERQVIVGGEAVKLSATEFTLLSFLVLNANRVLSYQQILLNVWGKEYLDSIDYVHVYMSHLRRKLEQDPSNPRYFQTEHGIGYRFIK